MKKLGNIKEWEISRRTFWVLAACVFAAKAILGWQQNIYIWVGGAPLDDELMYRAAQSITAGRCLGAYNIYIIKSLTLSNLQTIYIRFFKLFNRIIQGNMELFLLF